MYQLDQAVDFVAARLPPYSQARITPAAVEQLFVIHLCWFEPTPGFDRDLCRADDPRLSAAACSRLAPTSTIGAITPRRFLDHAREIGAIGTPGFPPSLDEWTRAFRRFRPVVAARRFAPHPLMVMHGEDDKSVSPSDARQLDEARGSAELSLIQGAGHRLRNDPRAIVVLHGWRVDETS